MKLGVIIYHSNILKIYQKKWIDKCIKSICDQTLKDYIVYEINYGEDQYSIIEDYKLDGFFFNQKMENYADAMNFLLDNAFINCDMVFNVNLDDYYDTNRFEIQSSKILQGYDIVSSNFVYVEERNTEDVVTLYKDITSKTNILYNFMIGNNVIAHPSVCYSYNFWKTNRYNTKLVPEEDFDLWKRSISSGTKFYICDEILLYYRIHTEQSSNKKK